MKRHVVLVNSVFPCLSETFVYDQFRALQAAGLHFEVASNHRPPEDQVHPRMKDIQADVHYLCEARLPEILLAHLQALARHPVRYLSALLKAPLAQERLLTTLSHITGAAILLRRFRHYPGLWLHAHFTYGAAAVVMWASRLSMTPYSLTLHGSDLIFDNPPDLDEKLSEATAVVSISRFNIDYLKQHFPHLPADQETVVIPMGVPPLSSVPPRPPRTPVFRILTVGRLSNHKAQHYLIDACALLAERGIALRCDIVGEGDKREFLAARIVESGLSERVFLLGPRFHHEVLNLYGETDLFVLCSITEGQPVVLMEAMRAGVPLVATAISAIPELVRDAGVLVPPSDALALADAIERFAKGEFDNTAMALRAQAIIAQDYNLEANHQRFKCFLEREASETGSG